jgi:hypothetical protein
LTIPLRRAIEAAYGLDPVKMGEVAQAVIGSVSPVEPNMRSVASVVVPQIGKPITQALANYDFFRGKPKVPGQMQNLPPEMQAFPYTSGTAKLIGKQFGLSPIKVEEFFKDTVGGIGGQVINVADRAMYAAGAIPREDIGGVSTSEAITARLSTARGGELDSREYEMRTNLAHDIERKAVETAKKTDYYRRISANEELASRYLQTVAQRAANSLRTITSSNRYKRMESDAKLDLLKRLRSQTQRTVPATILKPIKPPAVPQSKRVRYDLSAPAAINN